ncbi:DUF2852 domain-containing protein [Defluviimonas sp. WL0002]|uniref:DUF2852 domain-containing protein n=1 Tax=Albidovulum marisflavi TaxID=2984159 RepID=A0ABT2ZBT6_9RHOB|nr:DUF2852 domain-containing protein [Defluviimonas sp. WL0002]MCV2868605.1 DUF2852 domain-containing protein [Defluviimonas sp. WL0002]
MSTIAAWPSRAETWLDDRGKGAWIAAMVLGFIIFWPVGLALLAYMIWGKRMFASCSGKSRHNDTRWKHARRHGFRSSGNTAFDTYKADTLDRLEREQEEFEAFLKRLRESKDKSEFDQYLDERARAARDGGDPENSEKPGGSGAY